MLYLFYSLLLICMYIYSGLGLTLLFCPALLRKYVLFLSPFIGYCYLSLAGWWCYRFNLAGTDVYAPALMVPPFFLLCYALVRRRKESDRESNKLLSLKLIAPLAIGVLALLVISAPLIATTKDVTAVSLGNNDIANYTAVSRYVKSFARTDVTGYLGQDSRLKWLADEGVFGAYLSTAIAGSLFSLETYQVQNINTHVFFLFSILIFYVSARKIFQYNYYSALGITALYGLSPIIYYTAYQGFEAQIMATGLTLCLILINVQAINSCRSYRQYYSYIPFAVLLNWGMAITYPHMLPFVYVPVAVYVLIIGFYDRSSKTLLNWVLFLLVTLIVVVALSPPRAQSVVSYFFLMGSVKAGWFIPLLTPESWYGITFDRPESSLPLLLRFVLSFPLVVVFAAGFIGAYRRDKRLFLLAVSSTLPILAGYFLLSYLDRAANLMGGYKGYKLLSLFLPLILLGLSIMFRDVKLSPKAWKSYVLPLVLVILVGGNLVSCYATIKLMAVSYRSVDQKMSDLSRIEMIAEVQSINIVDSDVWDVMWEANFLLRKKLFLRINTYYPATRLDGGWNLKSVSKPGDNLLKISGFEEEETIPVNDNYVLEKAATQRLLKAQFGEGWYESEGALRWMGSNSDSASLILQCAADNLTIGVRLKYWALDSRNSLYIYSNGTKIASCRGQECEINRVILFKGQNILELKTSLPAVRPGTIQSGNNDQRTLSYAFSAIEIIAAKPAPATFSAATGEK